MDILLYLKLVWTYTTPYIAIIITISTLVGVLGLFLGVYLLWLEWRKYKNAIKLNRSEELVKNFQNTRVVLNPYLKDGLKLEVESYPTELIKHLKDDAYKDKKAKEKRNSSVIELIEIRNFFIDKLHNEELRIFYSDLQKKILDLIKQRNFIKCDTSRSTEGQINFFNEEGIELDVLRIIIASYPATPMSLSFQIRSYDNFKELFCINTSNPWINSDSKYEKELEDIGKELTTIFNDAIDKHFYLFSWYYREITDFQTHINEKLKQITDKMKVGKPLAGKCDECPSLGGFWRYKWQQFIKKYLP